MKFRVYGLASSIGFQLCLILLGNAEAAAVLVLENTASRQMPSMHAIGIQADAKSAFVWDLSQAGQREFWTTQTGGHTWNILRVLDGGKNASLNRDLRIHYFYRGSAMIYCDGVFYCMRDGRNLERCATKSVALRGQDGFKLEEDHPNSQKSRLARTFNSGKDWVDVTSTGIWFNGIESFDLVTKHLVYSCVYVNSAERGSRHRIAKSLNGGTSWSEICNPERTVGIWATHIFFLDENNGWISSDRDDGLFVSRNGGRTWRSIQIPERVVCGIFFKDSNIGRIIGGIHRNVYETADGGQNWKKLSKRELESSLFTEYFMSQPLSRWNDFAVLHTLAKKR